MNGDGEKVNEKWSERFDKTKIDVQQKVVMNYFNDSKLKDKSGNTGDSFRNYEDGEKTFCQTQLKLDQDFNYVKPFTTNVCELVSQSVNKL